MSISHRLIFLRILVFKYFLLIDLLIDESNDGRTLFNQIFCNKRFSLTYLNLKGTCGKKKETYFIFFSFFFLTDRFIDRFFAALKSISQYIARMALIFSDTLANGDGC